MENNKFEELDLGESKQERRTLAVIADDLAGASDAALQFAKQGLSTVVLLDSTGIERLHSVDVVALSSNSSAMSPQEAFAAVRQLGQMVKDFGVDMVYKKVDSALQGNIGPELEALMEVFNSKVILFAPAFPQNQRTTIGGYHLLNGKPLAASEVSQDLGWSIKDSFIPNLLGMQTKMKIGQLQINDWLGDEDAIVGKIEALVSDGVQIIVCDVWEDSQFSRLSQVALRLPWEVIWAGSTGFAQSLPLDLGFKDPQSVQTPVLTLAGSASTVSRRQVATQAIGNLVELFTLNTINFLQPETMAIYVQEMAAKVAEKLARGLSVTATVAQESDAVKRTLDWGQGMGLDEHTISERVGGGLAAFAVAVADKVRLAGMVVIGGDVSAKVCQALQGTGILVRQEIEPGIPLGVLRGGPHHGLPLVTKAGNLGSEDVLVRALDSIKEVWTARH